MPNYVNLLGEPLTEYEHRAAQGALTDAERQRLKRRASAQPRGYAAPIGAGPAGETCKSCTHARSSSYRSVKTYWKCALVKPTHGPGTDIRLKWAACARWEKAP